MAYYQLAAARRFLDMATIFERESSVVSNFLSTQESLDHVRRTQQAAWRT